jgi:putative intracellular protease/amidase
MLDVRDPKYEGSKKQALALLLSGAAHVYLLDFGIATRLTGAEVRQRLGTPLYMAPEVASGDGPEDQPGKADVWSLGVTLFQLATNDYPFGGQPLSPSTPPLQNPADIHLHVSRELGELLQKMLRFAPGDRCSMTDVVASLEAMEEGVERVAEIDRLLAECRFDQARPACAGHPTYTHLVPRIADVDLRHSKSLDHIRELLEAEDPVGALSEVAVAMRFFSRSHQLRPMRKPMRDKLAEKLHRAQDQYDNALREFRLVEAEKSLGVLKSMASPLVEAELRASEVQLERPLDELESELSKATDSLRVTLADATQSLSKCDFIEAAKLYRQVHDRVQEERALASQKEYAYVATLDARLLEELASNLGVFSDAFQAAIRRLDSLADEDTSREDRLYVAKALTCAASIRARHDGVEFSSEALARLEEGWKGVHDAITQKVSANIKDAREHKEAGQLSEEKMKLVEVRDLVLKTDVFEPGRRLEFAEWHRVATATANTVGELLKSADHALKERRWAFAVDEFERAKSVQSTAVNEEKIAHARARLGQYVKDTRVLRRASSKTGDFVKLPVPDIAATFVTYGSLFDSSPDDEHQACEDDLGKILWRLTMNRCAWLPGLITAPDWDASEIQGAAKLLDTEYLAALTGLSNLHWEHALKARPALTAAVFDLVSQLLPSQWGRPALLDLLHAGAAFEWIGHEKVAMALRAWSPLLAQSIEAEQAEGEGSDQGNTEQDDGVPAARSDGRRRDRSHVCERLAGYILGAADPESMSRLSRADQNRGLLLLHAWLGHLERASPSELHPMLKSSAATLRRRTWIADWLRFKKWMRENRRLIAALCAVLLLWTGATLFVGASYAGWRQRSEVIERLERRLPKEVHGDIAASVGVGAPYIRDRRKADCEQATKDIIANFASRESVLDGLLGRWRPLEAQESALAFCSTLDSARAALQKAELDPSELGSLLGRFTEYPAEHEFLRTYMRAHVMEQACLKKLKGSPLAKARDALGNGIDFTSLPGMTEEAKGLLEDGQDPDRGK